jgi:hypothetical protein
VTRRKAKAASLARGWPMWVSVIAVAGALAGLTAGAFGARSQGIEPVKGGAATNLPTPGGGSETEITRQPTEAQGVPGQPPIACPVAQDVTSRFTTTVSGDRSMGITSTLHVAMTGVVPPHPPLDVPADVLTDNGLLPVKNTLEQSDGAALFAGCFIATDAEITALQWADGRLEADLNLRWNDTTYGYTNDLLKATVGRNHATLGIDLCKPHPHWGRGTREICGTGTKNTVVVRTQHPIANREATPFPNSEAPEGDYVDTTWRFDGPMPAITVTVDAPSNVMAKSWLYWSRTRIFGLPAHSSASIDMDYIADASAGWLALITAAVLLRGKRVSGGGRLNPSQRLLLVLLAGLLLAVEIHTLGDVRWPYSNGAVIAVTWAILSAAVAAKRVVLTTTALAAAALVPIGVLASRGRVLTSTQIDLLITGFSIAMVALVIIAAAAVWIQVKTLFSVAYLDHYSSKWHAIYRGVIDSAIVVAFMFGLGLTVGEALRGPHTGPLVEDIALKLTWFTGLLFRGALEWISLLLAISYVVCYLISRPRGPIVAPGWLRWPSVRGANRTVAALFALTLCLAAPWMSGRFGLGLAIPVWVVQFGLLWAAFTLLRGTARLRLLMRRQDLRITDLLKAATGPTHDEPSAHDSGAEPDGSAGATLLAAETPELKAGSRLLVIGSEKGLLLNAKAAAQVASVIAVVPVTYVIWTTLSEVGGQLQTATGILIVALFAVLELTRWVISGFVFGYLYPRLPGRVGPVKALAFAAIWTLSSIGPLVIAQASGINLVNETIYRSAQFALFAIVLAVVIDLKTVTAGGGSWQKLASIYDVDLKSFGDVAVAVAPLALLILTLAQQIHAGSGLDVAKTFLSGVTGVLKGP